ncbi:S41 family peptidase [Deminuibacter soli]|uniref:Tricorn protease homolog n=1 Tax=Deminuibacter soli TaxID=2291815 RepID=A0A3E1NNM5_9BACT|nr:S41 family peptidase [Deminuibacter soli]RFM29523.1 peptidase S41 [Deminuibacter soli]
MKRLFLGVTGLFAFVQLQAQVNAGLFRYPDVSQSQIVFSYANDIWVVPKTGGDAVRLSSPPGVETYPKFSPDGHTIAFSGNYDGNRDVYVLPTGGGVPLRLTSHGYADNVVDWTPDGKQVLFASIRESGKERFNQFYTIPANGGVVSKLPLAYAEFGSYSPDGKQMALTFRTQAGRNWKRYRGGWKADIYVFNFATNTSENITGNEEAGEEYPMWHGDDIYFLSDKGPELRLNLWRYHTQSKTFEQVTHFTDYDVHFPSLGPSDIVFENGGKLFLLDLASQKTTEVKINVITDRASLRNKVIPAEGFIQHAAISNDGKRVLLEARGEVFSLPAENGYVKNLTNTSGAAERYPAWSPDGKNIAYWSDASGEYELYLQSTEKNAPPRKLTSYGKGFRYSLSWSPDSKKLVFIDETMHINVYDIAAGSATQLDKALHYSQGPLDGFTASWSPDSRWITYSRDLDNAHNAIFIYDYTNKKLHQVTGEFYNCYSPVFDTEGKYLFLATSQSFKPVYSDLDNTFIYTNSTQLAAISLKKSTPSAIAPKNDATAIKDEDKDEAAETKPADAKAGDKKNTTAKADDKDKEKDKKAPKPVDIDFDGIEARLDLLPPAPGNFGAMYAAKGKLVYLRQPNTGSADEDGAVKYYDINDRTEKTVVAKADQFWLSGNGEKLLVKAGPVMSVVSLAENQKLDKRIPTGDMQLTINPAEEWKQVFTDAWRLERDYFYDPNMHGVDWNAVRVKYGNMLKDAMTREEVNFIIGEMIGELNASHTYYGGGDGERPAGASVGYLGINWEAAGEYYKVGKIMHGAPWDAEARSPLAAPGIDIPEGSYILAVNGTPITTATEPYAAFQRLGKKTVELTYNSTPSFNGAKTAVVQTLNDEYRLRNLAWIEANRKRVEEATNGDAGYIFVPSTGTDGQNELMRQFNAQWNKKALIIDERFNNGGQIPDRFIEMLNRTPLAFWATRHGSPSPWPPYAHFGPKVMLINGWSGSGGDAFPDYFRKRQLGPLIGMRTWGGLIGISGLPDLIDGGNITAPDFRMYNPDGTWFKEGHGVDPDITVPEDLGAMARGVDPQLERAITEIKDELKTKGFTQPAQPTYQKR